MLSSLITAFILAAPLDPVSYLGRCLDDTCRQGPKGEELICAHTDPNNVAINGNWCTLPCEVDTDCYTVDGVWIECRYDVCTMLCDSQADCPSGSWCVEAPFQEHWCVWYPGV